MHQYNDQLAHRNERITELTNMNTKFHEVRGFLIKEVVDLITQVQEVEAAREEVVKKQATVEETNHQLITEKGDLEEENEKIDFSLECVMVIYKKHYTTGMPWQQNCIRQNHVITDLFSKQGDTFSNDQKAPMNELLTENLLILKSIQSHSKEDRRNEAIGKSLQDGQATYKAIARATTNQQSELGATSE